MRWTKKSIFLKRFEINRDSWESFFCVSLHPKNKYFLGKKNARAWATNSLFVLPGFFRSLVEISGLEPLTSALQGQRSTNWAIPPSSSILPPLQNRGSPCCRHLKRVYCDCSVFSVILLTKWQQNENIKKNCFAIREHYKGHMIGGTPVVVLAVMLLPKWIILSIKSQ